MCLAVNAKACSIPVCGASLCVLMRNQHNFTPWSEFVRWQSRLVTDTQAVATVCNTVGWFHAAGLTQHIKYSQFFHHHPKIMRPHSAALTAIPLAWPAILFSQGPPAVQSTTCSGLTLEESYLEVTLTRIDVVFTGSWPVLHRPDW
jgi:hypothetical protein